MKKQCTIMISAIMILLFVFTGCQSKPAEADMDAPKVIGVLNHEQAWELFTGIFGSDTRGADGFATECNDDLDGDGNADYAVMDSYGSAVTVELSGKGKIVADSAELNVNGDKWGKDFIAFGADVTGDDQREIMLLINIGQQGPESRCGLFVYEKSGDEYKPLSAPAMAFPVTVEWDCEMLAVYRRFTADMEPEKDGYSVMVSDAAGMEAYYAARDNQKRWLEIKDTPITNDLAAFEYCDAMPTYINGKPALALCQYVKGPDAESWERLGYFVTIITWDDKGKYEIANEFFAAPLFAQLAANKYSSNNMSSVTEAKSEVWQETYIAGGWLPVTVDAVMDIPLYVNYPVYKMEYYNFTTGNLGRIAEAIIGSVSDIKLAEDYSETKSASETQFGPMTKYTCKDEAGNQWKVVTRESNTTISAYANNEYVIQSEETVLAGNAYTGEPAGTTLDNVKISQEVAVQEVQVVMDELGICNMGLSHVEKARMLDPSNNTLTEGWYLRYMRCDGDRDTIPFLTSHTVFTDFENEFEPLRKECLLIFVDETGIVSFSWYSPSQQIASITDTQPPLTYAEAKDSIKAAIEEIAIVTKDNYSPECTLTIKNILLSNCVVQSEFESYTGYLLPTWIVEFVIDHGDGWTDNEQLYINSIDGSKLSNYCMTEAGRRIAQNYDKSLHYEKMGENEKAALHDAILRLYPKADEIAGAYTEAVSGDGWYDNFFDLIQKTGLILGGAGTSGNYRFGCVVEIPDEYCNNDLCNMYAAVLFAAVPNLWDMTIGNAEHYRLESGECSNEEYEHLRSTAVCQLGTRDKFEKNYPALTKPLEEYGSSGSGIRELLRSIADMSDIELTEAGQSQETPLHVLPLQDGDHSRIQ